MSWQLFTLGTGVILATVIFHVLGLLALSAVVKQLSGRFQSLHTVFVTAILLSVSVTGVLVIHILEAWAWAFVYIALGEFDTIERALYFSVVTSTTLGYGDITLSEQWQLLSTFEAMGGLILFGASTAFLLGLMRQLIGFND